MLTAAVLAAAVLGTTVSAEDGSGTASVQLLDPATLAPLQGSPRFPPHTLGFDLSPDRKRIVVRSGRYLRIYGLRHGRRQARVRVGYWGSLTWVTRNRILTTGCGGGFQETCDLTAVDARRGRVLRRTTLNAQAYPWTARVGRRWLIGVQHYGDPGVEVVIVDIGGRVRHRIGLPDFNPVSAASRSNLSGNLLADDRNNRIYAIDARTGTRTHVEVPGLVELDGALADGRQVITVQTDSGYERRPIDPFTLEVGKPFMQSPGPYDLALNERGFLRVTGGPPYIGAEGDFTFTQYGFDGAVVWEHTFPHMAGAPSTTIGDYVYVGTGSRDDDSHNAMHVLDLATGKELRRRPGFFEVIGRADSGYVNGAGGVPD